MGIEGLRLEVELGSEVLILWTWLLRTDLLVLRVVGAEHLSYWVPGSSKLAH